MHDPRDGSGFTQSSAAPSLPPSATRTAVGALMSSDVLCVRADMSLDALGEMMLERNISGVPVVDGQGRALGFVAASDIVRGMHGRDELANLPQLLAYDPPTGKVRNLERDRPPRVAGDVMRSAPPEVPESSSVARAITTLDRHGAHRLLAVAHDRRVVGIVSAVDLLHWVAGQPPTSGSSTAFAPLRDVLDPTSSVVACHVADDGTILAVTDGLLSLLGRTRAQLVDGKWSDLVDPRDLARPSSGHHFALRMLRSDDARTHVEWVASRAPAGGRLVVGHDVTRELRTRARLETELAVRALLDHAKNPEDAAFRTLALLARCEGWQWASLWWCEAREQRISRRAIWPGGFEPARPESDLAARAWQRGAPLWMSDEPDRAGVDRGECAVPLKHRGDVVGVIEIGGQAGPIEAELALLLDGVAQALTPSGAGAAPATGQTPVVRDGRLVEAERLALLGSLAGGIAHEINNALTWVTLSLGRVLSFELSRAPHTPTRSHRIELLTDVREGFLRVGAVAKHLAAFSRIDDEQSEAVDLTEILEESTRVVGNDVRHRARLVCSLGALPPVKGGVAALRKVVLNVLLNAAQAIDEGAAADNEIRVTSRRDGAEVVIEVSDTGIGIPRERLPQIFEPFYTTRTPGRGIGLGLSVARDIVQRLGGSIDAESTPAQGTTIRIRLPAAGALPLEPPPEQPRLPQRRRVLVVDDERLVAQAVALVLEDHDVTVCSSGREALERIRAHEEYDVVLCDLLMPEMTGMELYETLAREAPSMKERFVFMTGGAFTTRAQRFLNEVPNGRLQKPFDPPALQALVMSVPCSERTFLPHGLLRDHAN